MDDIAIANGWCYKIAGIILSNKPGQIEIHIIKYFYSTGKSECPNIKTRWLYLLHPFDLINISGKKYSNQQRTFILRGGLLA